MPEQQNSDELRGLSTTRARELLDTFGHNELSTVSERRTAGIIKDVIKDPMFLVLFVACLLYFILREPGQGLLMLVAMGFVAAISIYQEVKSSRALDALKKYTEPKVKCVRDGKLQTLLSRELVPGDLVLLEEGARIPADAQVLRSNDFSVDESIVTGESFPVTKHNSPDNNALFQGTTVNSGKCYALVSRTGSSTRLARIGATAATLEAEPTALQQQIRKFVTAMTIFGVSAFLLICIVSYFNTQSLAQSLLLGLTLAMSAIPEEIPVAFSSFMALGAWRMARFGIVVRHPITIENLGLVSVICLDKTGTLTENKMMVCSLTSPGLIWYARLACEPEPFDAMEQAIVEAFTQSKFAAGYRTLRFIHEYPLEGKPPMMTHVYESLEQPGRITVAAKGGPERIIRICPMPEEQVELIRHQVSEMAARGYRVLGVASAAYPKIPSPFPASQDDFDWTFEGLIALNDPPRKNVGQVLASWREAGIGIKIISGDYPETVANIAQAAGFQPNSASLTGDDIATLTDRQLQQQVAAVDIFARMYPEAKLRVIEALKANGGIIAMTGDGVNDSLALKAAHIGIAMGSKGTETAREAADLVLSDDNLDKITDAIRHGRTIYQNLKKAIRYLLTIHIPILTTASLPMLFGWHYPTVFTPIHIIFLELIMGPTCSIFYEREPVESTILSRPPEKIANGLLPRKDLLLTLLRGSIAATGLLALYFIFMHNAYTLEYTRTMVFSTLVMDNLLLTFTNRSMTEPLRTTFRYPNSLTLPVLLLSLAFLTAILLFPAAQSLFGLATLRFSHILLCLGTSIITIGWFELFKAFDHNHHSH